MSKITPCLWFDGQAEEAAAFYVGLFPDSGIDRVTRSAADNPSTARGDVLTVDFTLAGESYQALNGGPTFQFTEAISLSIDCADQAETDRYWAALVEGGGEHGPCGWLKDRFGVSWQVVPRRIVELMQDPDPVRAERAMQAMLEMSKLDIATVEAAHAGSAR